MGVKLINVKSLWKEKRGEGEKELNKIKENRKVIFLKVINWENTYD